MSGKLPRSEDARLNFAIAQEVFGMRVEAIEPEWYRQTVWLFFKEGFPNVVYSYDNNACNAMMYRNGKDISGGTAPPLPFWSSEFGGAWEVIAELKQRGGDTWKNFERLSATFLPFWAYDSTEELAKDICLTALEAVRGAPWLPNAT